MPTTYTASDQAAQPRQLAVGDNFAKGVRSTTVTLSVSDQIFFVKVPHGAEIVDGYISGHLDSAGSTIKVGVIGSGGSLTENNLLTTTTLSATALIARFNAGSLPVKVSLSDDRTTRYAWVTGTIVAATSLTQTSSITVVVEYVMPGNI